MLKNPRLEERRKNISDSIIERTNFYYQIIELNHKQKVKLYKKLPKSKLIDMLIAANDVIDSLIEGKTNYTINETN